MSERHNTDLYRKAFETFLQHTNEKRVLFDRLKALILFYDRHELLDIGAGNGDLAVPLSQLMWHYEAVEMNEKYIEKLRMAGLTVRAGSFPQPLHRSFEMALISHSLPWRRESWEPFVREAIEALSSHGILVIITYDDEKGAWRELLRESRLLVDRVQSHRLDDLKEFLALQGALTVSSAKTEVVTHTLGELQLALAFVFSDGDPQKFSAFMGHEPTKKILQSKYKRRDG